MKLLTYLPFVGLAAAQAQNAAPYTDHQSGISFNAYVNPSTGYFFGLALPENSTGSTDFIATIGGKGTGWSGVSLGGGMLNKLLIVAWPNSRAVVSSFRKTGYNSSSAFPHQVLDYAPSTTNGSDSPPEATAPHPSQPAPSRKLLSPTAPT